MPNIRLDLEFDGTGFHGWQKQPDRRTVQGVIDTAAADLFGHSVRSVGCCRTDAGVHAWHFVCNFETDTALATRRIEGALAARMPEDIVIKSCEAVAPSFNARYDAVSRRYLYRLTTRPTAVFRHVFHRTRFRLDVGRMDAAARRFEGCHDFTSFAPSKLDPGTSPVCTVTRARATREGHAISIEVAADRFLHHMVRNMAGTLIDVGRGQIAPERIEAILCTKDRRQAGPTAPAAGLALVGVVYPE